MDLLPEKSFVSGGPANTAIALALLGHEVEFIGVISSDEYGIRAREEMTRDGVHLAHALDSDKPTSTAKVSINEEGVASYIFTIEDTATFDFNNDWLPDPSRTEPNLLHIGTLATIVEPGSMALYEWAMRVCEFAPVVFDPNIRPAFLSDRVSYLASVERWISISSVVKASEDDLAWLYPETDAVLIAKNWVENGVALVIVTRGPRGLVAVTADEIIEVPGVSIDVVDTVGAGDTVGAVIVQSILESGLMNMRGEVLRSALENAALAAAISCSRAGIAPPTKLELAERQKIEIETKKMRRV